MRLAKITIGKDFLSQLLGIESKDIRVNNAFIDYEKYPFGNLVLILVGNDLPKEFEYKEGEKIKRGILILHHEKVETEIIPEGELRLVK